MISPDPRRFSSETSTQIARRKFLKLSLVSAATMLFAGGSLEMVRDAHASLLTSSFPTSAATTDLHPRRRFSVSGTTASYTVFIDSDGLVKARNDANGRIDSSGPNAATVISSAINALVNGGKVFIRAGTYNIDAAITPKVNSIELFGEGTGSILRLANAANGGVLFLLNLSNWYIHDLTIDGNRANQSQINDKNWTGKGAQACDGIHSGYTNNVIIESCFIHDCRTFGINAYRAANTRIHLCHLLNNDANGILLATCANSIVTENTVDGASDIGISSNSGSDDIIANNTVLNCNANTSPFSINSHFGIDIEGCEGGSNTLTVEGNHIENCSNAGIASQPNDPYTNTALSIKNNNIYSCQDGISLWNTAGCVVADNTIDSASRNGIRVNASNVTELQVTGNQISNTGQSGIYNHSDNATIVRNHILSSSKQGMWPAIYSNKHTKLTIAYNTVEGTLGSGSDGILLDEGCTYCSLLGNEVASCARDGIRISGTSSTGSSHNTVAQNTITNNSNFGVTVLGSASIANEITGNIFRNNRSGQVYDSGTGTIIGSNQG
jgi:parallel beta-helix repeat protein